MAKSSMTFGLARQAAFNSSCLAGSSGAMCCAILSIKSSTGSLIETTASPFNNSRAHLEPPSTSAIRAVRSYSDGSEIDVESAVVITSAGALLAALVIAR